MIPHSCLLHQEEKIVPAPGVLQTKSHISTACYDQRLMQLQLK